MAVLTLSNIISLTALRQCKHHKYEHFFELRRMLRMFPSAYMYVLFQPLSKTWAAAENLPHVFSSVTFDSETVFGLRWSFQKALCMMSAGAQKKNGHLTLQIWILPPGGFKFEELDGHSFSESFADSSRAGIVKWHLLCALSPMHLAQSAAPSNSSWLQFSTNFVSRN